VSGKVWIDKTGAQTASVVEVAFLTDCVVRSGLLLLSFTHSTAAYMPCELLLLAEISLCVKKREAGPIERHTSARKTTSTTDAVWAPVLST